jgi:AcrR family transcriptional regulator
MSSAGGAGSPLQAPRADARARIVDAMVQVVAEHGFAGASVGLVVSRARVSRRTFYEQFNGLEECFAAVLDLGLTLCGGLMAQAFAREEDWREGIRQALAELLVFFDSEPELTRIWFGEAMAAGAWALEHRERILAAVLALIVEYWPASGSLPVDEVLVKGVLGAIIAALTTHVVTARSEPLITLLAPLTSLAASPFVGAQGARGEVERAEALTRKLLAERYPLPPKPRSGTVWSAEQSAGEAAGLPEMLANPNARRARLCVLFLAEHPESSNYQVGAAIGIAHQGQTSKLLARLAELELLSKRAGTPGRPNAWSLTPAGEQVAQTLKATANGDGSPTF